MFFLLLTQSLSFFVMYEKYLFCSALCLPNFLVLWIGLKLKVKKIRRNIQHQHRNIFTHSIFIITLFKVIIKCFFCFLLLFLGATLMNQTSSRSHSIFTIVIECAESSKEKGDHIRVGKLNLVDLAGSERQSKVSEIDTSTVRLMDALTNWLTHSLIHSLTHLLKLKILSNVITFLPIDWGHWRQIKGSNKNQFISGSIRQCYFCPGGWQEFPYTV